MKMILKIIKSCFLIILSACVLTSCAPLLERQSVTVEPHSSKFWESEAAGTLRAESHQDIVNDLLLLIDRHEENATIRLYHFDDDLTVSDTLEKAAMEIQKETPLGSYAVAYITSSSQAQRGYYEVKLQIGYRRTAKQLQAIVNATSPEAVYSLLRDAYRRDLTELAVRIGYWGPDGRAQVEEAAARLREELEFEPDAPDPESDPDENPDENPETESNPESNPDADAGQNPDAESETESDPEILWPVVRYYPENGPVGLVEFLLKPPPDETGDNQEN